MPVFEIYSKRRARELGNVPDVYQYDKIPHAFKVQIIHIWGDAIGIPYVTAHGDSAIRSIRQTYHNIVQVLRREYGFFKLAPNSDPEEKANSKDELTSWFLGEENTDRLFASVLSERLHYETKQQRNLQGGNQGAEHSLQGEWCRLPVY